MFTSVELADVKNRNAPEHVGRSVDVPIWRKSVKPSEWGDFHQSPRGGDGSFLYYVYSRSVTRRPCSAPWHTRHSQVISSGFE